MAVVAMWQCDRDGSMFASKTEAQAYDRMLELAEHHRTPVVFFPEGGGGRPNDTDTGDLIPEPLWQTLANVAFWSVTFAAVCVVLAARSRGRQ